jgi:cardiolipin synthase
VITEANKVEIAATGLAWVGGGVRSIDGVLCDLIRKATETLDLTAYSITDGASRVFDEIENRLVAGVKVRIVIDNLGDPKKAAARERLADLQTKFPSKFVVWDYPKADQNEMAGLHAKLIIADRRTALIGSANLSFLGLAASHELSVCIEGDAASAIALCFDQLVVSRYVVDCPSVKGLPQ